MNGTNVEVIVGVDENYKGRISEIIQNLQFAGMNVVQSMEQLGVITGSIDASQVGAISQIEGVLYVEPSREFHLAPPDSDIQ